MHVIICHHGTRIDLPCRLCILDRRLREFMAEQLDHAASIEEQRAAEARDERARWKGEDRR